MFLFGVTKEDNSGSLLDRAGPDEELDTDERVSATSHDLIREARLNTYRMGTCNGLVYNTHRAVVASFKTGETPDGLPEAVVAAAICATLGS